MDLQTDMGCNEDGLLCVTFYDHEKQYGFSITRNIGDVELEVMVADQSCYRLDDFDLDIGPGRLQVTLPLGTIDSVDGGDDHFNIDYDCTDEEYVELIRVLEQLFADKDGLHVTDKT
jgi:hypothetical protein